VTVNRGFLNWGLFLIFFGAVPLAVELGVVDRNLAGQLLRLWPLILIGIGIGLLLSRSRLHALGGALVAATFGFLIGAVVVGGISSAAAACSGPPSNAIPVTRQGAVDGAVLAVDVEISCGDFDASIAPGATWSADIAAGSRTPVIEWTDSNLALRSGASVAWGPFGGDSREQWTVRLPSDPALRIGIEVTAGSADLATGGALLTSLGATYNAADGRLDLSGMEGSSAPASLGLTLNASSVRVLAPERGLTGGITLNASSLTVCTAPGTGVRIEYEGTLSSNDFAGAGLAQVGRAWESADYGTVPSRVDLHMTANVSSVSLNPSGGCQ
jgi:hypothetical protein